MLVWKTWARIQESASWVAIISLYSGSYSNKIYFCEVHWVIFLLLEWFEPCPWTSLAADKPMGFASSLVLFLPYAVWSSWGFVFKKHFRSLECVFLSYEQKVIPCSRFHLWFMTCYFLLHSLGQILPWILSEKLFGKKREKWAKRWSFFYSRSWCAWSSIFLWSWFNLNHNLRIIFSASNFK